MVTAHFFFCFDFIRFQNKKYKVSECQKKKLATICGLFLKNKKSKTRAISQPSFFVGNKNMQPKKVEIEIAQLWQHKPMQLTLLQQFIKRTK